MFRHDCEGGSAEINWRVALRIYFERLDELTGYGLQDRSAIQSSSTVCEGGGTGS